ncbi:MAG TPA: CUAEP/CCAEP-tail radical SAM protein, partial [Chloroflexota bacterium]|nr:CUAEP/CCAEP-tail radical SAM protein [Chloroflexota bacterium]
AVACLDLAVQRLDEELIAAADLVAFYVPMHTATRLAAPLVARVKALNPTAHLCFYGLYAPVNEGYLRTLGADTILGGEFEEGLVALARRLCARAERPRQNRQHEPVISLARQQFLIPDRGGLPELRRYAHLNLPDGQQLTVGYTEATRGCKHLCRHCPIPPVYEGVFRVVQPEVVLEDIARQVRAGARHITFGDPDFFNGPGHAVRILEALHRRFPELTYDVTIKVEHLLRHARHLPTLCETGCLFVTSAVEAVDDRILEYFDKRHTRQDFIRVVALSREVGLTLNPTFVTLTPWTSLPGYLDLLSLIDELGLVENVSPIQYAIRLLIPAGSKLLELPFVQDLVDEFDEAALCYRWSHPDPRVDRLYEDVLASVKAGQSRAQTRREIFAQVWQLASEACGASAHNHARLLEVGAGSPHTPIPHLSEPWYC